MNAYSKSSNGDIYIWMNLIGFDKDDDDCGAKRFIEQTGFVPDGVCALLFHPDFIHHHRGMAEEYALHPDNCAYQAVPRNAERARQEWTNYDLRTLCRELKNKGCDMYAGLMGCTNDSAYHGEWIEDYPEIYTHYRGGVRANHCLLKRFSDGTYYEDFFIGKLCETLKDYGMKGVHLADCFSPMGGNVSHSDYSTDLTQQFLSFSGCKLPEEILLSLGDDSQAVEDARADWIWENLREEWIRFLSWRWKKFFKKLCDRLHAIGCEVMTLGMYCTDPFETLYCLGTDISEIVNAGVDCITENILPTGCYLQSNKKDSSYRYNRLTSIVPLMAAHTKDAKKLTMLGLYDATEEWDILHHAPCMHKKDMYGTMAYHNVTREGVKRCVDGYFLCLGDGISRNDWDNEYENYEKSMSADVESVISPLMLWSDYSYKNFLGEYIKTRRHTPFKLFYELANSGTMLGGCVRSNDLDSFSGTLFVADFDMLSPDEKEKVITYDRGTVLLCTYGDEDMKRWGIKPCLEFSDGFSSHPLKAYVLNYNCDAQMLFQIKELLSSDDNSVDVTDIRELKDFENPLFETLPFTKVSKGFIDAMALILKKSSEEVISADKPYLAYKLKDGNIRTYLYNDNLNHYSVAFVNVREKVEDTKIVSEFPVLPVRYKSKATGGIHHNHMAKIDSKQSFEVKLPPGGLSVVDIITVK